MQDRFRQILEEKKMTANRFAECIDVNASAVSHILTGRSKPSFDFLNRISRKFPEINMNWLISGKGEMYCQAPGTEVPLSTLSPAGIPSSGDNGAAPGDQAGPVQSPATTRAPAAGKTLRKIILFYDDGTFETYG